MLNTLSSKMQKYVSRRSEIFSPAPERPLSGRISPAATKKPPSPSTGTKAALVFFVLKGFLFVYNYSKIWL